MRTKRKWITHNIRRRRDSPVLIAPFGQPFHDISLVAHEPQEPHDLLSTRSDPEVTEDNQFSQLIRMDQITQDYASQTKRVSMPRVKNVKPKILSPSERGWVVSRECRVKGNTSKDPNKDCGERTCVTYHSAPPLSISTPTRRYYRPRTRYSESEVQTHQ